VSEALAEAARQQAADSEAYRRAPYPSAVHAQTQPDRLATVARLAGLDPPDVAEARVLEVGCGNGLNLMAMAAANPGGRYQGFDVVGEAIADGRRIAAATGIAVDLFEGDLLDDSVVAGEFDYIVAHGVLAWVPPPVADALIRLIGRHLAPDGVAFVSFAAYPGSYLRHAIRDRMVAAIGDETDDAVRLRRARDAIAGMAEPVAEEDPPRAALRHIVEQTQTQLDHVMLHDELGGNFNPRYLADVIRGAAAAGLRFLGDAQHGRVSDAFLAPGADLGGDREAQVLAAAVERDWNQVRFFRNLLLVRDGARPDRTLKLDRVQRLFVSSRAREREEGRFHFAHFRIDVADPRLRALLRELIAAAPARVRIGDLPLDAALVQALYQLFDAGIVQLHTQPWRFAMEPSSRPEAGPLARFMAREGSRWAPSMDGHGVGLTEGERAALADLKGAAPEPAILAKLVSEGLLIR
jgi:SAM-dependent methyltransferase